GRSRLAAGFIQEGRDAFGQAARLARELPAPELLARTALGVGLEFTAGVVDELEVRLLEEALGALGEADGALRARVLARLAKALLFTPFPDPRLALSQAALAIRRRSQPFSMIGTSPPGGTQTPPRGSRLPTRSSRSRSGPAIGRWRSRGALFEWAISWSWVTRQLCEPRSTRTTTWRRSF